MLDRVRAEPILDALPGGEIVGDAERGGSNAGFGSSTGRQVLWRYDGSPDEVFTYYQSSFPDFDLRQDLSTILRLTGSRGQLGADYVASASVEIFMSVDEIPWDRVLLEPDDITQTVNDGEILVLVSVFSG